jgi:hypothetical protein
MLSREGEQPAPQALALIFRCHEQLVEIKLRQMQRQHARQRSAIVGDVEAPAFLHLQQDARAQLHQQRLTGILEPRRGPAVHPDARDLVIFVGARGTDGG